MKVQRIIAESGEKFKSGELDKEELPFLYFVSETCNANN